MSPTPPSNSTDQHQPSTSRRGFLGKAAVLGAASLSGCLGGAPEAPRAQPVVDLPASVQSATFVRECVDGQFNLRFSWTFGPDWEVAIDVPSARYEVAVTAPRSLGKVFDDATRSGVSRTLAATIGDALDDLGVDHPVDRVRVATSFARCLRYTTDEDGTGSKEYPRYVAETLVENEGDCEDFAAILAGIFGAPPFDADPRLVILPGHSGIGVDPTALGLNSFTDPHATFETAADDRLPTIDVGDEELLYIDPTYPVRPGVVPKPYREYDVVASYDGDWHIHDLQSLTVHLQQSILGEGISDPTKYI